MTEATNQLDMLIKSLNMIFRGASIIQKSVANGNKYCGVVYVPKRYRKHKAIVILLEDENT